MKLEELFSNKEIWINANDFELIDLDFLFDTLKIIEMIVTEDDTKDCYIVLNQKKIETLKKQKEFGIKWFL